MSQKNNIIIVTEGGIIQRIISEQAMPDTQVIVIDYDTEGADDEEIVMLPQGRNRPDIEAVCSIVSIDQATSDVPAVIALIEDHENRKVNHD